MHLYFNGDSNMSGEEIVEGDTISSKVSERLGATKIVNHALSGASNDYIYRTTMEYLTLNTPDFVLIGVTEMGRGEWLLPWNDGLEYIQLNNIGVGKLEIIKEMGLENRFEHWKEYQKISKPYHESQAWYWHEKYYNLHKLLQYKGIKHLFFHAFHTFRVYDKKYQLDWEGSFYEPYTIGSTYIKWCEKNGYKEMTPGFHHYESSAQAAWAEKMIEHAQINGVL